MTDDALPADRLNRVLTAVETIEESLGVLARKQQLSRDEYRADSDTLLSRCRTDSRHD